MCGIIIYIQFTAQHRSAHSFDDGESNGAEYHYSCLRRLALPTLTAVHQAASSRPESDSRLGEAGARQLARACDAAGLCSDGKRAAFPLVVVVDPPTAGVDTSGHPPSHPCRKKLVGPARALARSGEFGGTGSHHAEITSRRSSSGPSSSAARESSGRKSSTFACAWANRSVSSGLCTQQTPQSHTDTHSRSLGNEQPACALEKAVLALALQPIRLICALGHRLHHLVRVGRWRQMEVDACATGPRLKRASGGAKVRHGWRGDAMHL